MKELFLKIDYSDFNVISKVFSLLHDQDFDFVEIEINTSMKFDKIAIKKIFDSENILNKTIFHNTIVLPYGTSLYYDYLKKYRFKVIFEIDASKKWNKRVLSNKIQKLKKKKIEYVLRIKNCSGNITSVIDYLNFGNVKYDFENIDYSNNYIEYFRKWIYDKNALQISFFDNVINTVLLKTGLIDCRYSSCLGKRLYLSKNNVFSFCPFYPEKTVLANLSYINTFNDIFEQANILNTISNSIKKRNNCINNCEYYDFCKGGCPILETTECKEKHFIEFYNEVKQTMEKVVNSNNLDEYNTHVKNAVLKYIVFNNTNI